MRTASLMMVLLLGTALVADEPKAGSNQAEGGKPEVQQSQKPANGAAQAADAKANGEAKQDDPKQDDDKADGQKADGEKAAEQPIHKHPTLQKMLSRNNQLRQARGLRPHRINPALTKAAQDHAAYMARTRVFSHYSNGGPGGRASKHGFGSGVLENIGYGYGNVETVFSGWHNSGGHYANMMSGTTDAGFGYAVSPDGTPYWVAVYGTAPKGQEPVEDDAKEEAKAVELATAKEPVKDGEQKPTDGKDGAAKTEKVKQDPAVVPASPK